MFFVEDISGIVNTIRIITKQLTLSVVVCIVNAACMGIVYAYTNSDFLVCKHENPHLDLATIMEFRGIYVFETDYAENTEYSGSFVVYNYSRSSNDIMIVRCLNPEEEVMCESNVLSNIQQNDTLPTVHCGKNQIMFIYSFLEYPAKGELTIHRKEDINNWDNWIYAGMVGAAIGCAAAVATIVSTVATVILCCKYNCFTKTGSSTELEENLLQQ